MNHERPVGDSPEFMPLDTCLFQDMHLCALSHVLLTSHLPHDDPRKFSFDTPIQCARTYKRLGDPYFGITPKPSRILQDVNKWVESNEAVRAVGGVVIQGVGTRTGHRADEHHPTGTRGGSRKKKAFIPPEYHFQIDSLIDEVVLASINKIRNRKGMSPEEVEEQEFHGDLLCLYNR